LFPLAGQGALSWRPPSRAPQTRACAGADQTAQDNLQRAGAQAAYQSRGGGLRRNA